MADNILLIEGGAADAKALLAALTEPKSKPYTVERVTSLADGLARLKQGGISLVLLDLLLPDSQVGEAFDTLFRAFPYVPVVIVSDLANEGVSKEACGRGAKDYFLQGQVGGYSLPHIIGNVIERSSLEKALFAEMERARVTLESIGDAVLSTDIAGNISYLNPVAERMTGWNREHAVGRPLSEIFQVIDSITREPAPDPLDYVKEKAQPLGQTTNCILIRRDGKEVPIDDASAPIRDRDGKITGAVIVFRDIEASRLLKMSHLALHDSLTDLPNRALIMQRLIHSMALAKRHDRKLALLFVDLDCFKDVNDTLGHAVGDMLLQSVAQRLLDCSRNSDTVSRQGGDEFVLLVPEIQHRDDAALYAEKIVSSVRQKHSIAGHDIAISASVGIGIYPDDGNDAETILKAADTAMYHAKWEGRNRYAFFNRDMAAGPSRRAEIDRK